MKDIKNQQISVSEALKHIIIKWVNEHQDFLKKDHNINFKEIMDEIEREKGTWKRMMSNKNEKIKMNEQKQVRIQKLIEISESFDKIEIDLLARQFNINSKSLKNIILEYKNELEKHGVKPELKES